MATTAQNNDPRYWIDRMEQEANRQYTRQERYELGLLNQYRRLRRGVNRELENFYRDFATENRVSMAEARQYLNPREQSLFRQQASPILDRARIIRNDRWDQKLKNGLLRNSVSRLDVLMIKIEDQVRDVARQQYGTIREMKFDTYEDHYNRISWLLQRGDTTAPFKKLSPELIERTVGRSWLGSNYSRRLYKDQDKLIKELRNSLVDAFSGSVTLEEASAALARRIDVAESTALRLLRTEANQIMNQAVIDAFKRSGVVGFYQLVAIQDSRISKICKAIDGKVFALEDYQVGTNFPPLHPNCRTTVAPYFRDKAALDRAKNFIFTPDNIGYGDWLDKIA